jgi:hypothetical protein
VTRLSATARTRAEPSLYSGLGGDVTALKLLDPGREQVALGRLAHLMTPAGWPTTLGVGPGLNRAPDGPGAGHRGRGAGRGLGGW